MSIVPPASATLVWAFPTPYEEVRCFVWEHSPAGWSIAVMFGDETLALEVAPTRWAMEAGVELVWHDLLSSKLGKLCRDSRAAAAMSGPSPRVLAAAGPTAGSTGESAAESRAGSGRPRRFEDPFCPRTPFRHRTPSIEFDSESSDPSSRRRPH